LRWVCCVSCGYLGRYWPHFDTTYGTKADATFSSGSDFSAGTDQMACSVFKCDRSRWCSLSWLSTSRVDTGYPKRVVNHNWFWYNVVFSDIAASNLVPVKSSSLLRDFTTSCLWSIAMQFLARVFSFQPCHVCSRILRWESINLQSHTKIISVKSINGDLLVLQQD